MQAPLDAGAQTLRRPQGVAGFPQLRFLFRRRLRLRQFLSQAGRFRGQRLEKTFRGSVGKRHNLAVPQIPHPLGYFCDRPDNRPPDHKKSNQYDQQNLRHHMPKRVAPDPHALRLYVRGVMEEDEYARYLRIPVQRQHIYIYCRLADFFVVAYAAILVFTPRKDCRWSLRVRIKFGTDGGSLAIHIVNSYTRKVLAVSESIHKPPELARGTLLQDGLHGLLQALRKNFGASFQIGAQTLFFRADLVSRHTERDDRDCYGENWNQTEAELHCVPPLLGKRQRTGLGRI